MYQTLYITKEKHWDSFTSKLPQQGHASSDNNLTNSFLITCHVPVMLKFIGNGLSGLSNKASSKSSVIPSIFLLEGGWHKIFNFKDHEKPALYFCTFSTSKPQGQNAVLPHLTVYNCFGVQSIKDLIEKMKCLVIYTVCETKTSFWMFAQCYSVEHWRVGCRQWYQWGGGNWGLLAVYSRVYTCIRTVPIHY